MAFTLLSRRTFALTPGATSAKSVLADVSGDGVLDVVFSQDFIFTDGTSLAPIKILVATGINNAGGPSDFVDKSSEILTNGGPLVHLARRILTADFNGDGKTDIFLANTGIDSTPFSGERNTLLLSTPSGKLIDASATLPTTPDYSHSAIVVDVNGDKAPDILINNNANRVAAVDPYLLMNNGKGTLTKNTSRLSEDVATPLKFQSDSVVAGDFNSDGFIDLAFGNSDANRLFPHPGVVYLNDSKGNFSNARTIAIPKGPFGIGESTPTIQAVDINGDGWLDLILNQVGPPPPGGGQYSGGRLAVYINNAGKSFTDQSKAYLNEVVTTGRNNYADKFTIVDQNGDGLPDIFLTYTARIADIDPVFLLNNGPNQLFTAITVGEIRKVDPSYNGNSQVSQSPNGDLTIINTNVSGSANTFNITTITETGVGRPRVTTLTENPDHYIGTGFKNVVALLGGNDLAEGRGGNDSIDGGAGLDTAIFRGKRTDYSLAKVGGEVTVTGLDGTTTLKNVERIQFTDGILAPTTESGGQVTRLYQAALNRAPERGGYDFWQGAVESGAGLMDLARFFIGSREFTTRFGANLTTAQFVDRMYQNVLQRQGEPAGAAFWNNHLTSGNTRESVLNGFAQSAENREITAPLVGVDQFWSL